jgi:hypothetical protein
MPPIFPGVRRAAAQIKIKTDFEKIRENFLFACASDRFVKRYAIRLTG